MSILDMAFTVQTVIPMTHTLLRVVARTALAIGMIGIVITLGVVLKSRKNR